MMKKVIFVGGTSYSGSTFLDMILAHDPAGFSCGEVWALFRPFRKHHVDPECGCGNRNCTMWKEIHKGGEKHLYENIFALHPEVNFIVDSSKMPFWIRQQTKRLRKRNIEVKNVLIWKTPMELAQSYKKRGRLEQWENGWIHYHRMYFSLVDEWKAIRYYELTNDKDALATLCGYLGIPYFKDKEKYWLKTHHTLFGNDSAKIHLLRDGSEDYWKVKEKLVVDSVLEERDVRKKHKKIFYDEVSDDELKEYVAQRMLRNKYFNSILSVISEDGKDDLRNMATARKRVRYSSLYIMKNRVRIRKNTLFNKRRIV